MATHKKNSDEIQLCIDPQHLNKVLKRPHHPMCTVEDVTAQMPHSTVFSTLDAKSSFCQIPLHKESSKLKTFSTPFGRFKFLRMLFGISSASEVFQHTMEQIFAGYPCAIIVDDIIVGCNGEKEYDENLKKVLDRARQVNLRLNPLKCKFRQSEISYVGHLFTSDGLKPDHQQLVTILSKPLHTPPARLQRMMLRLQKYTFQLMYKKRRHMHLADTLSRAPLETTEQHSNEEASFEVMSVQHISSSRLNEFRDHTARDKDLQALCMIIQSGWPKRDVNLPASVRQYFTFRDELAIEDGIVMKGPKAVIPQSLQREYITILHRGHPGTEATKRRARSIVFWPSMSKDIEKETSSSATVPSPINKRNYSNSIPSRIYHGLLWLQTFLNGMASTTWCWLTCTQGGLR